MRLVLLLVVAAIALALAAWAHVVFWTRRFGLRPLEDELVRAVTSDGWTLALARHRARPPARSVPVLLVHGIAANHFCMDFPLNGLSLAAHLAGAGFDAFALDLRGHGRSRPGRGAARDWDFDTYLEQDLPAAIDAVRAATGAARVALVGHSQGALLSLAAAAAYPDRVGPVVAIAGPARFDAQRGISHLGLPFAGRWNRLLARAASPYAGYWHPRISQAAWNANNVDRPVYRRVLVNVVEDIPRGVLRQFERWISEDCWASRDGRVDYRAALARARPPGFFVAAVDDLVAPPPTVRVAHDLWGGERAFWVAGREGGCGAEYGHTDLLIGRRAPEEVYPRISRWLEEHAG